jgi:hypothetical protein
MSFQHSLEKKLQRLMPSFGEDTNIGNNYEETKDAIEIP